MKNEHLAKLNKDTGDIMKETLTSLVEGVTGIAASERKELALSVGHIFQSLRKGQFLSKLYDEWSAYRKKGRIKDDYLQTEQHATCFQELLDFLEHDSPDEVRFDILKKIFLIAATEGVSDRNSLLPYQFLRLCRRMSSGEILILNATYRIAKSKEIPEARGANQWIEIIAKESGLEHASLVELYEDDLVSKRLLIRRIHPDRSGVVTKPHFRLTTLGFELCEYINNFDEEGP